MSLMCFEAQKWISVTVDNECLPGAVSSSLSAHLASCPSCQRALAEETKRCQLLGAALQEPATSFKPLSAAILEKARRFDASRVTEDGSGGRRGLVFQRTVLWRTVPWRTVRWRIASWAAAALLLFSSSWLVVKILVVTITARTSNLVPVVRGRSSDGPSPFNVFVEQDLLQKDVVPADDGSPFQRERHMQRRTFLDDLSPGGPPAPAGAAKPRTGWDMERMDLRYQRLIEYPYQ